MTRGSERGSYRRARPTSRWITRRTCTAMGDLPAGRGHGAHASPRSTWETSGAPRSPEAEARAAWEWNGERPDNGMPLFGTAGSRARVTFRTVWRTVFNIGWRTLSGCGDAQGE